MPPLRKSKPLYSRSFSAYASFVTDDLRHEAEATLAARQEVGQELEPHLVDRFVERVEQEIERRAQELADHQQPSPHYSHTPLVLGSLGIAIPLIAVADSTVGVIAVCIAIVLVNLFWATRRL
jgi:hypothetical protein